MDSVAQDWFKGLPKTVPADVDAMLAVAQQQRDIIEATKEEFFCPNGGRQSRYLIPKAKRKRWYPVEGLKHAFLSVRRSGQTIVFKRGAFNGLPVTQESIDAAIQHSQKVIKERKNRPRKSRQCRWCNKGTHKHCQICQDCINSKIKRIWEAANSQCCLCGAYTNDVGKVNGKCGGCMKKEQRRQARESMRKTQKARRAARSPGKVAADNARRQELRRQRTATDNEYAVRYRIQKGFQGIFQRLGTKKPKEFHGKWKELIGCTTEELTKQFEEQFKDAPVHPVHGKMGWHNKQHWDIDHIFPSSRCCALNYSQLLIVWNHKNLRPMWREDNGGKNNKITPEGMAIVLELAKQQLSQALAT